jgi:iron complex transport system ATP-binding protein
MEPLLRFDRVVFGYGATTVLNGISLEVRSGEMLGILGPNGSGKSTLLNLMDGILCPRSGAVLLDGVPIRSLGREELARRIAMVSQEHHFRFPFSALQVVLMGRFPHLRSLQFEGPEDMAVVREALRSTQCLELANRSIHELSGGERQRVLIARALAQEPRLVLLDEPTSFLDLKFKREIFRLIDRLSAEKGLGIVVVSHDIDLVAQFCSRILLLKEGAIHAMGDPGDVITSESVETVFDCPVQVERHPLTGRPRVNVV